MKLKLILLSFSAIAMAVLPGCTDSEASAGKSAERPPENGAQFKKGEGLSLTDEMARSIDLKTAEVTEEKIAAFLSITLHPVPGGQEASGWLTAGQAEKVKPGAVFNIATDPPQKATVLRVEKPAFATAGDFEVTVAPEKPLTSETEVTAVLDIPAGEDITAIPREALLTTAEGQFVYAKNGKFFVRTPVKAGVMNNNHVEIVEGLYSGDEVVTSPVMSLWMAELQVLRGGKACTCGH